MRDGWKKGGEIQVCVCVYLLYNYELYTVYQLSTIRLLLKTL